MSIGKSKKARVDVKRGDFDRLISIKHITGKTLNAFRELTGGTESVFAQRFAEKQFSYIGTEDMKQLKETPITWVIWRFDYLPGLLETMTIVDEDGNVYDIVNIHDEIRYVTHKVHCKLRA